MDLRGYTTVDEVGEDPQVRSVVDFRPTTAAEEIEYLNKILENMENYDSKENSKSDIPELESAVNENDPHNNHIYNNNALDLITEVCSETLNVELGRTACGPSFIRDETNEKLEQLSERCTIKEFIEKTKSDCNEVDIKECGLPCADDILTQAENQHSVIQDIKSGHVQNELSTEPNLIMADPAIPDVEDHFRQSPGCTHSNFSPKAELEDKLEAHSIEPVRSDAANETGSSELSSSTKEATIMPVNCSAESSSVLESRHYSAKETFDFISGEDVSESSTLDSIELGDVSSLSNVVLGDIGSLLENSIDQPNVTDENTPAEYETQIDLSIVKSEPVCTDPGEDFDLKNFCSDPGEEFVLKESSIKEEPLDDTPTAPVMNQEEVLLPVKIFKSEGDSSGEQVVMPNIRYLIEEKKEYSREEVAAALIISQSSLSPIIDMEMFQNLGKTKLAVSSIRLEDMLNHPKRLALEDFNVVQLFRSNYGSSLHEWKAFFKFRGNYSVKHTAKKSARKQSESAPPEKRKGKRGRKKKCETEVSNSDAGIKGEKVENEGKAHVDDDPDKTYVESTKPLPVQEEREPEKGILEKKSLICKDSPKVLDTSVLSTKKGRRGRKKKCSLEPPDTDSKCSTLVIEDVQVKNENVKKKGPEESAPVQPTDGSIEIEPIKEEAVKLEQGVSENENIAKVESELKLDDEVLCESKTERSGDQIHDTELDREVRTEAALKDINAIMKSEHSESKVENSEASQQLNLLCKACYVCLYDIAEDATYGVIVRKYLQVNNGKSILKHCIEKPMEEDDPECKVPQNLFSDDSSDESFTGFSPGKQREALNIKEEYLVADEGKENPLKEMEHKKCSKKDQGVEKLQFDVDTIGKKDEPHQSDLEGNIEIGSKHRKEVEKEVKLQKESKGESNMKREEDSQNEKDARRARKRLKLENEGSQERRISPRDKRKSISEDNFSIANVEDLEREENASKPDGKNDNDGAQEVLYAKKNKEEILTTKDRNPASSPLPALSSFRIPKKKVTHIGESKPQQQNSVLLRRGESPATQKSVGYSSKKQFNAQSRKADFREKERQNARNIKNESKPVIPVQQPVNEGWAKRGPPPPYGGVYHPQPGFPNMLNRNVSPASGTHLGPGSNKMLLDTTMNQQRMQLNPYDRGHMTAKADHSSLPCPQIGAGNINKPVRQINTPVSVPPPPPLQKLYPNSSLLKQGSGSIQATPYESSPVMSYGNSSDGESDVAETEKTSTAQQAQSPLTTITVTPITDLSKTYKTNLCNTQLPPPSLTGSNIEGPEVQKACLSSAQPLRNVTGMPDISVTETCKLNVNQMPSPHSNSTGTLNIITTTKASDKVCEEILNVKGGHSKEDVSQTADSSKDKVESREGASRDYYQNLDRRQKIKLYEKRKRYYQESRKKYYAEKGDKKHFWLKEYEKRKKEYYHLKIYLYKEKKKEQMASKIHKESQDSHNNSESRTSASAEPGSPEVRETCNTAVEAEEIPYSPTASPIDFDDIDVTKSLPDEAPKKLPTDDKEQIVIVDYPTDKLKEMLMLVMNTLNRQSSDAKSVAESNTEDTEARSKESESVEDKDEYRALESTSLCSSPLQTSESFLALNTSESFLSSSSMPLPLKEILLPSVSSSSLVDKAPVSIPLPSLPSLPLSSPASSITVPKDSLGASVSSTLTTPLPVPPPQPVPPPNSVSPISFSLSSNKKAGYDQSPLISGKHGSCPNSESRVELPVPAPPLKSSLGEKPCPEIAIEHSVQTSLPRDIALPPLPSSPAPLLLGQESSEKMPRFVQDSSFPCVTHGDKALPPLPPPPPRPSLEELVKITSESCNADVGGLEAINAKDDMTAVPMEIDSDEDKNYEAYDKYEDKSDKAAGCQDKKEDNNKTNALDSHNDDNSVENREVLEDHEKSDSDFLALFGVFEDKSADLEKETGSHSTGQMTELLRKLMNVTNRKKPVDEYQGDDCRQNARLKENYTPLVLDRPQSAENPVSYDEKEMDDHKSSTERNALPVTDVKVGHNVNIVPDEDSIKKATRREEAEVTSLPSCSKVNRKRKSCDEVIGEGFKSEIEIITPKEPPKNLICVDEILLSVEAADQPTDLQIIYADLRKTPREKPNIIRDEVPKYYQKTALAQALVDRCKDLPLVGLQYVLEVRKDHDMTLDNCYYICAVCSKKMTAHTLVAHIKSVPHRLKFSEAHCKNIYEKYGSYELKEWTGTLVKSFTMDLAEVEKKMGRHKLAVAVERDMPSVLKSLKQKVNDINSLGHQQEEKTKVAKIPTPSKPSDPTTAIANSTKDVPLSDAAKPNDAGTTAASSVDTQIQNKSSTANAPEPQSENTNNKNEGFDDNEEDEVLVLPQEKTKGNAKKFSSNGQGFPKRNYRPGPNVRHRSSSRSSTPSLSPRKTRSRSRSNSRKHSKSPPRKKPDRHGAQRHGVVRPGSDRRRKHSRSPVSPHHGRSRSRQRDIRKRYRSRSRSRSRHRSPPPYRKSRRSSPPKRETAEEGKRRAARRRLEEFREVEVRIKARHKNEQIVFEKTPESHPLYNREWKIFWERRCRELEKEGLDPFLYDFKSEWAVFWHHRMKELMEKNFKSKRDALLRKFRLDDPDLEENKAYGDKATGPWKQNEGVEKLSRIDRSPSPWEDDAIARNPSPKPGELVNTTVEKDSSKSTENPATKFEDDFSVIGTLKLLNEMEDQLGSFGPAITTLLGKAVDCSQKGEDTLELFKDPDNLVLVRYAREKLSSQISAGILGVAALVKTQMAVERSMWLQSQAEKLANEGKYLGLDITGIARATLGRDTVQIAQYIAQHLLQVGKSNASESDLQNILYAVLAAHTKLLVETSKKPQGDTPVTEGATPVSAPNMSASSDHPKELPPAPSGTLEGTKQPLFPSTASSNSADEDKGVDSGDKRKPDKVFGGLGMLQSAYEEENGKDMENLSLDDLRSLLSNFNSLSAEEKQALTTYLKKLEATDSKKVMKLREEIQKSARNAAKGGNVKSASKAVKGAARSQGTAHTDNNSVLAQQQPSEASQMSTHEAGDQDMRLHSRDSTSQPPVASSRESFMDNSRRTDLMHDSRGPTGLSGGLDLPIHNMPPAAYGAPATHNIPPAGFSTPAHNIPPSSIESASRNMPPAPGRMAEVTQDFGPAIGHKPDRMDQPPFDNGCNRPFPQRPFLDRQESGPGMSDMKQDRNYDRFGYEPLPNQNNPVGPDGSGRFDRPGEARFDRPGEGRFDRPGESRFDGPGEPRLDRPGEPRFDGPGEPRFGGPGEQRFGRPGESRFDGPGEPRFDMPGDPRFDGAGGQKFDGPGGSRFDGPGGPRFDRPGESRFDGPAEPKFDRPGEQRFGGPGEPRFGGPGEPRFDRPGESRFDGPGGSRFNRPGEPMFGGPGEPGFDRPGESRFGRPGEPFNKPQWQGFGRGGGPQGDDRAFPPQDERHYQWFDEGPQGPNESRDFGPRGRAGHSFRGGPRRGFHANARKPYREPW